jgi:hypothetical protein
MGLQVVQGAMMKCSFGAAPATLSVTSNTQVNSSKKLAATIMDHAPMANIAPFGMCNSIANPQVAAATAAAAGVLTPQPCIPATAAPWAPGCPKLILQKFPALNDSSICMCNWGGVIKITNPGQTTENIP